MKFDPLALVYQPPGPRRAQVATFFGMRVVLSPDLPRYVLPAEVIPGVPWPAGFRDELNAWSTAFLGTTNLLPLGTFYKIGEDTLLMRREDLARYRAIVAAGEPRESGPAVSRDAGPSR